MTNHTGNALDFTEEQALILAAAQEFCRDRAAGGATRKWLDSSLGYDPSLWTEMAALGWAGLAIPEVFGGSGMTPGTAVTIAETLGRYMLSAPFVTTTLAAQAILRGGTAAQQQQWLPRLAAGDIATVALLESEDWGDDRFACGLARSPEGWMLSGRKLLVVDAAAAALYILVATLDGDTVLVLVPRERVAETRLQTHVLVDETRRAATVDFSGIMLPDDAVMPVAKGATTLRDVRLLGALLTAAEQAGSATACLRLTLDYLNTRRQFGRLIGSYQALKHPAVEILLAIDAARSLVYHAATVVGEGTLGNDAEIACRMAKAQASEALLLAGDRAVQFHGAMGFTYECDAQLYIRRALWARQQFGDAYHHRKRLAPLLLD